MRTIGGWEQRLLLIAGLWLGWSASAGAISFDLDFGDGIRGTLNTTMTLGAAVRTQDRAADLVGKANLDPTTCGRGPNNEPLYEVCVGLFRNQTFKAEHLISQPGQLSMNADDGNLNYARGDLIQAPFKVNSDLTLNYGDFGLFIKTLYFYDFVNNDFNEVHPNRITPENRFDVGFVDTSRYDAHECPEYRRPPGSIDCGIVYGPGGYVQQPRRDGEVLRQIGTDLQLLDFNFFGYIPLGEYRGLSFKIGRQTVNWGESTALLINSLNQANAVNVNNLFRVGASLDELFVPSGMVFASTELFGGATIEGFYGYEWEPVEIPAPGSFFAFSDLGTNNAIMDFVVGFGGNPEDPEGLGLLGDNPLSAIASTSGHGTRLPDREPEGTGQYGVAIKYFAEWLNDGTELGLYYMNYHSKLPYVSFYAVRESCSKGATSTATFFAQCPDVPALHQPFHDPEGATDSAINFDDIALQFEYPENIQMVGASFNTTFGELALQGEISYRPDMPLQVSTIDLAFAAYGPTLTNCHLPDAGCEGTTFSPGNGRGPNGDQQYGASDFVVDAAGTPGPYTDTFDLLTGHMSGSGRSFPSFVVPYRGGTIGLNSARDPNLPLDRNNPGYLRGWEHFDVWQGILGGTYIQGATNNWFGADQVIWLFELGAQYVPDLPALDQLQIEAPGVFLHASAGADGSGADRSRQACSTNPACSFGPDGGRFNPHQADLSAYPDAFSWGYALITVVRYESLLPGISVSPLLIFLHDVEGTSTDVGSQFTEGRQDINLLIETRYKSRLSFNVGYTWFTGAGANNLHRDRDNAQFFVKYQF